MKKGYLVLLLIVVFSTFSVGCNNQNDNKDSRLAMIKKTQPTPVNLKSNGESISKDVKKEVLSNKVIYDAAVIEGKNKILVAYKVRHMYRFKMKSIEKKLTKQLEQRYPKKNFIVSSDYKIFLETVRFKQSMDSGKMNNREAKKRFNSIINLTKELT